MAEVTANGVGAGAAELAVAGSHSSRHGGWITPSSVATLATGITGIADLLVRLRFHAHLAYSSWGWSALAWAFEALTLGLALRGALMARARIRRWSRARALAN